MNRLSKLFLPVALQAAAVTAAADIEITVYNDDLALIKDTRTLELNKGAQEFSFTGVPERLLPETVHFISLTDPEGTQVLEQNYRYDLLSRGSLLERYRGQTVKTLMDGEWREVTLLAHGQPPMDSQPVGRILEVDGEIHIEGFILPSLPEGLLLEPTLVWLLDARKAGKHKAELSYLSAGLSWKADYVAVVDTKDQLDLTGWVTLNNRSGMAYPEATLKLVAGDVNRVRPQRQYNKGRVPEAAMAMDTGRGAGFAEEAFFEYHLYTLGRPTTLLDNEQKQVELLSVPEIKARRKYQFRSANYQEDHQPRAVNVVLEFANKEGEGPGIPLPKGIVRVYQADKSGQLQFAGEDAIEHTPEGEDVDLKLGSAFDLRGERQIMRTDRQQKGRIIEQDIRIALRNHKDETVEISILEDMPSYLEWRILRESHEYKRLSARQVEFVVKVPAKGEVEITYTARTER